MAPQEVFLPACPKPLLIQPHERIEQLRGCLDDPKYARQKTNILALIKMYEIGQLGPLTTGYTVYICDGKIWEGKLSSENLPPPGSVVWAEVGSHLSISVMLKTTDNLLPFLQGLGMQMMQQGHPRATTSK